MAIVKYVKGPVSKYIANKTTYDTDGTIFVATDAPYLFVWGQQIGVDESDLPTVEGEDAITVTTEGAENTVALKIAAANKVLSQSAEGLTTTLKFKDDKESSKIQLVGIEDAVVAEFSYEQFIVDGMLDDVKLQGNNLVFTFNTASGPKTIDPVDLSKYIDVYTAGDGISIDGNEISVNIKEGDSYITVTEDGVATKGIDEAIAAAVGTETARATGAESALEGKIEALEGKVGDESVEGAIEAALDELDLTEVGGEGKYIKTVKQENGLVTATAEDLTATNVKATAITGGTATNVQGILGEIADKLTWHDA